MAYRAWCRADRMSRGTGTGKGAETVYATINQLVADGTEGNPQEDEGPRPPELPPEKGVCTRCNDRHTEEAELGTPQGLPRVRLTNGIDVTAYIPGIGHNLQEHSVCSYVEAG